MAKTDLLAIASSGSRALRNAKYEKYCRLRASAQPRDQLCFLMREILNALPNPRATLKPTGIAVSIIIIARFPASLTVSGYWAVLEANIKDYFETYEVAKTNKEGDVETDETGKMITLRKQRAKLLSDLPDEIAKLIENVQIDAKGNVIPKLMSKLQANRELRQMLNIGGQKEREQTDVSKLSDAELISQLAEQAKELGIHIDLNYSFHKRDECAVQVRQKSLNRNGDSSV